MKPAPFFDREFRQILFFIAFVFFCAGVFLTCTFVAIMTISK